MKKFLKITLGCAILVVLMALSSYKPAAAEAKAIDIHEDTFKVDLDGNGKDEEIYTRIEYTTDDWLYSIDVSINGKKVYSQIFEDNHCIFRGDVSYIDINPKDKYKDVIITVEDEFSCREKVYRYKKKKLKLLFDTDWVGFLEGVVPEQKNDKNVLMYEQITTSIGNCFYVVTNNKIKKQKLKEIKPKDGIYTVVDESWGGRDYTFILAKDVEIYSKPDGKKVKKTLKEGTEFYVTKLKLIKGEYALISLVDGESEIGWLDLSQQSYEDMLVTRTYFAG